MIEKTAPTTSLVLAILGALAASAGCEDGSLQRIPGAAPPTRVDANIVVYGEDPDQPHLVDFGEVPVGEMSVQEVTIENDGTDTLQVRDLMLPGSDSLGSFQMLNLDELVPLLTPDTSWVLEVGYSPVQDEARESTLTVASNDRDEPTVDVRLVATGLGPQVEVFPPSYDFGSPEIGCEHSEQFTVSNVGRADLTVDDVFLEDLGGSGELFLDEATVPSMPQILAPGESFTVDIWYSPDDVEPDSSVLHVISDDPSQADKSASQFGIAHAGLTNEDQFLQQGDNSTDILWVVDDSCSMSEEQTSLATNFTAFMGIIEALEVDFHIGVTTTDVDAGGPQGMLQGSTPIITPSTPDPEVVFSANVNVGTSGSATERGLHAGYLALSSPMVDPGGPNDGFLRDTAGLRVMFVSDEPEQSQPVQGWTAPDYSGWFQALKPNPDHVVLSDITGGLLGCNGAGGSADEGQGYVEATVLTGGISASICDSNWASTLSALAWLAQSFADTFELSELAVADTVEVRLNDSPVFVGWVFDPALNAVVFDPDHIPDNGVTIDITYTILGSCGD